MYIPFAIFGGNTCLYYVAINEDVFGGANSFNYTDCNNITQSVVLQNYTAQYFSVNAAEPVGLGGIGSEIKNTTINSPINNLPIINDYYQIVTSKAPGLTEQVQATLYVPSYTSSFAFDYFSINTADNVLGRNSETYITSYPQFSSVVAADYTVFPIEDTSSLTTTIDYLVVGGGGAGGNAPFTTLNSGSGAGGGGAGGLISGSMTIVAGTTTSITVGAGGQSTGSNGQSSSAFNQTAIGGGFGGFYVNNFRTGSAGGSGGGGIGNTDDAYISGSSGLIGQGNGGGSGYSNIRGVGPFYRNGGGGGGASQRGFNGFIGFTGTANQQGGAGGSGSRWVDLEYYAGGGGGAGTLGPSLGGVGGGGIGAEGNLDVISTNGENGKGGGGGGGYNNSPCAGGDGVVKIRYPGPKRATGGTITYQNGYTYHTFTTGTSDFTFYGGNYPDIDYTTLPTSSLAITSSLVCLIDAEYSESFIDFKNQLIYDLTQNSTNVFNQLSSAYSYVTSSTFPYIEYNGRPSVTPFDSTILRFNNIASLTPINNITLVAVYNIPKFTSTANADGDRFIPIMGDVRAQRSTATNDSQLDAFGIFLSGSSTGVFGPVLQHHNDDIILPFSSSIDGWHITQMSYDGNTNTITWANDNITGSTAVSNDNWYRFTLAVQRGQNLSVPNYFETGSKFKLFAAYTSSLSSAELIENYNFISQSLI